MKLPPPDSPLRATPAEPPDLADEEMTSGVGDLGDISLGSSTPRVAALLGAQVDPTTLSRAAQIGGHSFEGVDFPASTEPAQRAGTPPPEPDDTYHPSG